MTDDKNLKAAYDCLSKRDLTNAIIHLHNYLAVRSQLRDMERLYAIQSDFQLMSDYWKRGFKDPQASDLFDNLLRRTYMLYGNIVQNDYVNSAMKSFLPDYTKYLNSDWSLSMLKADLENAVSNMALLELEPEHTGAVKKRELLRHHQQYLNGVFVNLLVSPLLTSQEALILEEVLLAPTVESRDQMVLVSALTLAGLNLFDFYKFRTLLHVYQHAIDQEVRQRALVGWVLMAGSDMLASVYADEVEAVENLLEDKAVCQELIQLQQQIVLCLNAEKDNETIQKEIMQDLIKNSNIRITRNGIEEVEEDSLNDILHPDEEERRMEKLEESVMRMQEMQNQGVDIYYAGFSQMKRFPFFRDIINWFMPFFIEHPDLEELREKFKSYRFMQTLSNIGPFCNSDKYSFLFAFATVIERIPQSYREMIANGQGAMIETSSEELQSAAYIRRMYLQDLYRFYRLYPERRSLRNPFSQEISIFFANPIFSETHLEPHFTDVAAFLIKKQRMSDAGFVLANCGEARHDFRYEMMAGYLTQHKYYQVPGSGVDGILSYQRALKMQPQNETALRGYARALMRREDYNSAEQIYDHLLTLYPGKRSHLLNRAICLMHQKKYQEAENDLFRLNYELPDDEQVNRVLAWTLTCDGKYEQAIKLYSKLLTDNAQQEDLQNYGYCLWLNGNISDAADCFHRYLKESKEKASSILENERKLLQEKGITEAEMQMMLYIV